MAPLKGKLNKGRGYGYRLGDLEELNEWFGDKLKASITLGFGVPVENYNRRRV